MPPAGEGPLAVAPAGPVHGDTAQTSVVRDRQDVPSHLDIPADDPVDQLIEQLGDDDPDVRQRATDALVARAKEAVPAVLQALSSTDPEVRARAQLILTRMGEAAVPQLAQFIGDPKQPAAARGQMGLIMAHTGRSILAKVELQENEVFKAIPQSVKDILQALRKAAADPSTDPDTQTAFYILGGAVAMHLMPFPLGCVPSKFPPEEVAEQLEQLLGPSAVAATLQALRDPAASGDPRRYLLHGLLQQLVERAEGPDRKAAIVTMQEALLHHEDAGTRATAARLIGAGGDRSAGGLLLKALEQERTAEGAAGIVDALGLLKVQEAVPQLIDMLKTEKDELLLESVAQALGQIGDRQAADPLISYALDPANPERVRREVVKALKSLLGAAETAHRIELQGVQHQPAAERRRAAVEALRMLEDQAASPMLQRAFRDPDAAVRLEVVKALGDPETRHLPLLQQALHDPERDVREAALYAIWRGNDNKILIPALITILGDSDTDLRKRAARDLAKIGREGDTADELRQTITRALQDALKREGDEEVKEVLQEVLEGLEKPS